MDGREGEGADLFRNALAAAPLCEAHISWYELNALDRLISLLFTTRATDELEPLVVRFQEAAKAESQRVGRFCVAELSSLVASARLHEVLSLSLPPPPLPPPLSLA